MTVWKRSCHYLSYTAVALLAVMGLAAAEHHGTVKFAGLPVPGATITAVNGDKKLTAVTDGQGAYSFPELADGVWSIQVEMLCFAPLKQDVAIAPGAPSPEWELKLLSLDDIKKVAAEAPPPTMPPSAKGQDAAGTTAAAATPAATASNAPPAKPGKTPARPKGSPAPPTNGQPGFQRTGLNAAANAPADAPPASDMAAPPASEGAGDVFAINGSSNNGAASRFAQTPAFGNFRRGPGWLYHGLITGIFGNSALDANSFSVTGQETQKPAYNHLVGNASIGGPLIIPHLIKARQNNINFFAGYSWTRTRNATTNPYTMPTLAERGGDFSQATNGLGQPVTLVDPQTGLPFPGNIIPTNRISPQAKALLGFYPLPNFNPTARYNYQVPLVNVTNQDAVNTRISKTLNNKNQVFGTFAFQRVDTQSPNVFAFQDQNAQFGLNSTINLTHRFSNRLFAHLQYQYSRMSNRSTPYFANRQNVSGQAGITGNDQEPQNWGPPNLSFASSGIAGLGDAQQSFNRNQTSALSYDTTWNHTPHNITFGADFRRQQYNYLSQQNARGSFGFTGTATGYDFADFLLGVPDTASIAFGNADKYFRESVYDAYITDDWRATPSFTLNAGMRWEYSAPITEVYGRLVNLDIAPGYSAVAPVVANSPLGSLTGRKYPDSLVKPDKAGFQPRIGFSWRPISGSSLVVHGGYGMNFNTSVYQSIANQMAQQSPLSKSLSVQNSPADPLTLANGFVASPGITTNNFAIDPNFRVGYVHNWKLDFQEDLPAAMILNVTYLGIKGTRGMQAFLPNTYPAGAGNPCPLCPSGFTYMTSNGNSTRESGQVQLRRRLHNGFTATVVYTFAKAIDDAVLGGRAQGGSLIAQNWLDLSAERALSNFDQRHLVNLQLQYTTGMGLGGGTLLGGWRGRLFKEWTVLTNINAGSGLPLTPNYPSTIRGTGVTGVRPEYTGADLYAAPPGLFLNPAAYIAPLPGLWGNAGRNSITGPSQFGLIASMQRTFRLRDRINADLRFDASNALNHVTYPNWNTTITSPQFGLPGSANAMRAIQATVRVRF